MLWIGFQRRIEFLNLETNSELDLRKKWISTHSSIWKKLNVFGSRSCSISELKKNKCLWIALLIDSELKKNKCLWIALLIDFWTRTELLNLETNSWARSEKRKKFRARSDIAPIAQSEKKIKCLWIALLIDFWTEKK